MKMDSSSRLATIALSFFLPFSASACDLCSIYSAVESAQPVANTFRFGLAEQFTSFGKVQNDGHYVENEGHQHMESTITQFYGNYDMNQSVSFQASIPYISRRFKRVEGDELDHGTEAGIGDMSLLAKYNPYQYREDDKIFFIQLLGGIKLATGDSKRISEELNEGHSDEASINENAQLEHSVLITKHDGEEHAGSEVDSAIHGHDLALGTGSYDFPLGFNLYASEGKVFAASTVQYVFRTRGDYDYEYADDLTWEVGPGYYIALDHDYTVALKANLSGEYKRKDNLNGEIAGDTGIRSTFLGPELVATAGNWSGELGWDIPLNINNTEFQAVPDYKLRAALTYRF